MKARSLFLILLVILSGGASSNASAVQPDDVEVWSGPCESRKDAILSHGMGFKYQDHFYVVTSHHRVYNGNESQGVCHWITSEQMDYKSAPAHLLAWDWGAGLALLEGPAPNHWVPERTPPAKIPTNLSLGVPYASSPALAVNEVSDRHYIPVLPGHYVVELSEAENYPADVGMPIHQGGPGLFPPWVGILSHQYIAMTPGRGSQVETWDFAAKHIESHLLMIPGAAVDGFLDRYFQDPKNWKPTIQATLEDQVQGRSRVSVSGLSFEEECGPSRGWLEDLKSSDSAGCSPAGGATGTGPMGGGEGHGMGGGEGHGMGGGQEPVRTSGPGGIGAGCGKREAPSTGIGGPQGRGLGGGAGSPMGGSSEEASCRIRVYRNAFGTALVPNPTLWPERAIKLFDELKVKLKSGGTALLPFAYDRDGHRAILPHRYYSLQHFFRQLEFDRKDVIMLDDTAWAAQSPSPLLTELRTSSLQLADTLPKTPFMDVRTSAVLLSRVQTTLAVTASESWKIVFPSDLDDFIASPDERSDWVYALPLGRYPGCGGPCIDVELLKKYMAGLTHVRDTLDSLQKTGAK
jgi:hypothetical protein